MIGLFHTVELQFFLLLAAHQNSKITATKRCTHIATMAIYTWTTECDRRQNLLISPININRTALQQQANCLAPSGGMVMQCKIAIKINKQTGVRRCQKCLQLLLYHPPKCDPPRLWLLCGISFNFHNGLYSYGYDASNS